MLVDLGRNDLGRVSEYGSVQVRELMTVERYSHVMHLVLVARSEVAARADSARRLRRVLSGGDTERRPQGASHADHRRAGTEEAGNLRRLDLVWRILEAT